MKTTELILIDGQQAVRLPEEFRFQGSQVSIRRSGEAVILELVKANKWPDGFFESFRIDDPKLKRPSQGNVPPAPVLDA